MADAPPLRRQESFAKHAEVFNGLFAVGLEEAKKSVSAMAESPEAMSELGERMMEAQRKAAEGDDTDLRALQTELAEKHAGKTRAELEAVWDEFDADKNNELSKEEARSLTRAYLIKSKEWMPKMLSSTIKSSMDAVLGLFGQMAGGEDGEDAEELNAMHTLIQSMEETVISSVTPAVDTALDGMIEDYERVSDDLMAEMDLDKDGRVTREEFLSSFQVASQRVMNPTEIQAQVQETMQAQLASGAAGCPMQ